MNDFDEDAVARHVGGATVVHQSPFGTLEVPSAPEVLSEEECEKWVVPFYRRTFRGAETGVVEPLKAIYHQVTPDIVERLGKSSARWLQARRARSDAPYPPRIGDGFVQGHGQLRISGSTF
jgi:hypothetical protein